MPILREFNGGIGLKGDDTDRMKDISVFADGKRVSIWVEADKFEVVQYLTPQEAMAFSKAFERAAIQALKNSV